MTRTSSLHGGIAWIAWPLLMLPACAAAAAPSPRYTTRSDIPTWWKQTLAFYCPFANSGAGASLMKYKTGGSLPDKLKSFRDLPDVLEDARKLGTDVIYLVDYWEPGYEYKGTYTPWAKCGGTAALRDGIAAVHAKGGRVIVYLEAFIISRRTEFGRKVGPDWAMMNEKGEFHPYFDTGDRFYLMYPGEGSGWTSYLADLAGRMARDYAIDGVHLDSYGLQWNWKDYNPKHPNGKDPQAFNRAAVDLVRRVRTEMRKHNPEAIVVLEGAEQTELLDVCDGAQIESLSVLKNKPWWKDRKYPIFTSSFELAEMRAILDEGYQLALSPWWLQSQPRGRDEKNLAAKTDKRNRFDQIESLNRYNNLLLANGLDALPLGSSETIGQSIIEQLNGHGWKGEFVNPSLDAAAKKTLKTYAENEKNLSNTPADRLRQWLDERTPRNGSAARATARPLIFGINSGTSDRDLQMVKAAGGTNVRIGAGWDLVEPEPGKFDWSEPDEAVQQCVKYGLEPIFLIVATPKWALSPEKRDKPWGWPAEPPFYPQARAFYRTLAARYKGRVRYYEFWNEQNGFGWHAVNLPDEYAPILKLAYAALKEGDPDCIVAVGGLDGAGWKGYPKYLERLYELGCGDSFDAVAAHPYRVDGPIDGVTLKRLHDVLVRHGHGDRNLWLTEYGWSNEHGHDNKARWLAESLDMLTSPEFSFVTQASIHTLRDFDRTEYGMCDRKGSPRAAYYVFKNYPKDWGAIASRTRQAASATRLLRADDFEAKSQGWQPFGDGFEIIRAEQVGIAAEDGGTVLATPTRTGPAAGGAYLRLAVPDGVPVRVSARVFTVHGGGARGGCRVGVDPAGGTSPDAPSVVWSRTLETYDAWDTLGVGQGEPLLPASNHVTVFLRYERKTDGCAPRVFDSVRIEAREDTFAPPNVSDAVDGPKAR